MSQQPPPPTPSPGTRTAAATRDRIARAALLLFTSRGFHETTTPMIARQAGVAEGTLYRHFPGKQDLLNEVFRAAVRALQEPWRASDPAGPLRARLDVVADRWAALAAREPALVTLALDDRLQRLLDEKSRTAMRDLRTAVAQAMAAGKAAGVVRAGPADLWAEIWLGIVAVGLARICRGAGRPDDSGFLHVKDAAWDAVQVPPLPRRPNGTTISNPVSLDSSSGAAP